MLLPEVLDFATRVDHILTQLGESLLVVGAVEPEEEHFCCWWLIPTILPYVVIPKITQNYAVKNFITDFKVVCCVSVQWYQQDILYTLRNIGYHWIFHGTSLLP